MESTVSPIFASRLNFIEYPVSLRDIKKLSGSASTALGRYFTFVRCELKSISSNLTLRDTFWVYSPFLAIEHISNILQYPESALIFSISKASEYSEILQGLCDGISATR